MEFRKSLLSTVAGAALIAFAGGAYAAGDEDKSPGTMAPSVTSPRDTTPAPGGAIMPAKPGDRLGAAPAGKAAFPPAFITGKSVLDANGDKVGTVSKIIGNDVIVSVGGFLGIGSHDVLLPWDRLSLSGTGDDAKLRTALTKEELKAMPEYEEPATGSSSSRPSGSMGGSSRSTR